MKQVIPNYTFDQSDKTVTFTDYTAVELDRLLLIVNVTRNVIYYNFADPATGATVATNVFTLVGADTTGHDDLDKLLIFYEKAGTTSYQLISAATTNGTLVRAGQGSVYAVQVFNINASPRYLKLYDKASQPTVGTDVPKKTILIPGNTAGAGAVIPLPPMEFALGIGVGVTTGVAVADTGAVAASEIIVNLDYD